MPPLIAAAGAAIAGAIGLTGIAATIVGAVISVGLSIGVSKLVGPRGSSGSNQQEDAVTGARVQLPPATNNKLPVVYGTAFIGGSIIDAKISSDLQTMWYVIALAEVTNTMPGDTPDTITFDELYYDGKLATLSGSSVTQLTTNTAGAPEVDTKISGNLDLYLFPNGSFSGTNTGGQSAIDIMSDSAIPANQRWNQGIYTAGGQSAAMTNTAFIIAKVKYNQDAGTTSLGAITAKITNSRTLPGDCIRDYLLNSRYGCGVDLNQIDEQSLIDVNTYSNLPIVYTPEGGGPTTTQPRYRLNGPIDTSKNCLANLQDMVDACDSWMQFTELTGKWKVVINKGYNEGPNPVAFNDLYLVDNNNLTGGITLSPTDLNQTYNQVEYQYPNTNIKDQLDYIFISLQNDFPALLSENEPINKLTIKNDLINNYVQAKFIAIRRLLQGREDLIINLQTDYSGIQVEAGDVIRVTNEVYGWTEKLFRVSNVVEEKDNEGNLFARLTAFEYNPTIYDDDLDITDFIPEANTGLLDPNIIPKPDAPAVALDTSNPVVQINVTGVVPNGGLVRYLDFNYGTSTNTATHTYYTTSTNSNGAPIAGGTVFTINVNDIKNAGNLYWSVTAKNDAVGVRSDASTVVAWPGSGLGNNSITLPYTNQNLDITQAFGGTNFTILTDPITNPVSVTSTSTRNIPVIIPASSVANTNYYPWYQGTSSSSSGSNGNNFYGTNSTSSWNPTQAGYIYPADGDDDWYSVIFDSFLANTMSSDQVYHMNFGLTFVSNADAVIQILPGFKYSTNPSYYKCGTDSLHTMHLTANLPQIYSQKITMLTDTPQLIAGAVFVRNITPTAANVTVVKGSLASSKGKTPFF